MTTTDSPLRTKWRPRIVGAAVVLLVATAACSSTTGDTVTGPTTSSTAAAAPSTTTTSTTPDPAQILAGALDRFGDGYEYIATVTVNDEVASTVEGRWNDGASQATVRSGEGAVEYLITAEGQWARLPDGEWELLEETSPSESPLEVLSAPETFDLVEQVEGNVVVQAVYPAARLGLESGSVEVTLTFSDGYLVEASYETSIGEHSAASVTTFRLLSDTTPITSPPA